MQGGGEAPKTNNEQKRKTHAGGRGGYEDGRKIPSGWGKPKNKRRLNRKK